MRLSDHFKMATFALLSHKLRSSLTMLGIIIGNASVIGMVAVGEGARKSTIEQFEALGPNVLYVSLSTPRVKRTFSSNVKPLLLEDAEVMGKVIPKITNISPEIHIKQLITYQDKIIDNTIKGTTSDYLPVRKHEIERGRFINDIDIENNQRVVVLGAEIAKNLFNHENPIGQQIRIRNVSFNVIGTLVSKGALFDSNQDNKVLVPITTAQDQLRGSKSPYGIPLNTIALLAKDKESVESVQFQVRNLMLLRHGATRENDVRIFSQNSLLNMADKTNEGLKQMLAAVAIISLLVGGIGVMNIMLVSVKERTEEIGLRKALGASQKEILGQFMLEAILLAACGSMIGIGVGLGGVIIADIFFSLATSISIPSIVIAVSVSSGVGFFFGVLPAKQAAKLDPIIALKN